MIEKLKQFMADVSKEMKKVAWPTKEQLQESTIVVVVVCIVITAFVFAIDTVMDMFMKFMF